MYQPHPICYQKSLVVKDPNTLSRNSQIKNKIKYIHHCNINKFLRFESKNSRYEENRSPAIGPVLFSLRAELSVHHVVDL